ncbi:primosomal protein N' [Sandaracinobacter sp. RS1-74]|uniref:primosomal protein N' n=1 Tax=Sandaracinobacteroides sayramensis TaxID=2913411 RepID=UPI001EDBDA2F|nr:primosomal protein N' [Sandaracinobacteroides sayramensis]MCG2841419.1 primosomal protein N' [Sandaracinobacteroides sayramensis]
MSMRGTVLLLQHGLGALHYRLPDGTPPGTVVDAPLGPRRVPGVLWDEGQYETRPVDEAKLRDAVPLDLPPLPEALRRLLDFVADYYLAAPASVLRMALPQAAFVPAARPAPLFALGEIPEARHAGRRALLERLEAVRDLGVAPLPVWAAAAEARVEALRALVKQGVLLAVEASEEVVPARRPALPDGPQLSDGQKAAADAMVAAVKETAFQPFLLDGVTGAGKTEVYLEAVAQAISGDGQALVLLPEIALTEAWLQRFRKRFGFSPTVWHSGLTPSQRRDAFRAIVSGEAAVIVGARSALFLGAPKLRLIVVDEAHDQAFKQEESVPYHGRDVAVMRARFEGCPVVLATATPSLETMEQVQRGTYKVLHLPDRHGGAKLPKVHLIDLTRDPPPRGRWIAPPLAKAIEARLGRKEQVLLFLNRRGYAPLTLCRKCGDRIQCPNCTAWLVEHRLARRLMCHHCGHSIPVPESCPSCGAADSLAPCGPGVERLAEEVAATWPEAKALVATSDSVRTPADMAALVAAVADGEVDILIGTQMLAKGHDFPNLTLVGVVDADLGLEGGDLRAGERCFQQIRQVSGRAGRGEKLGEVFLQTHQPRARVMQALWKGDAAEFQAAERDIRLASGMPPFGRLAAIVVSSMDGAEALDAAKRLGQAVPLTEGIEVWGPAPAPLAMLRGRHRHRLLVHAKRSAPLQAFVREWLGKVPMPGGVRVTVDVDPQSFL